MQENLEFKMSMLVDDELGSHEALRLYSEIRDNPSLMAKWNRLNAVTYVMRHESGPLPDRSFLENVSRAIADESPILSPMKLPEKTQRNFPAFAVGLAASIAAVAMFSWSYFSFNLNGSGEIPVLTAQSPDPTKVQKIEVVTNPAVIERLNDYLITHNESTYPTGTPNILPYARVVSHPSHR